MNDDVDRCIWAGKCQGRSGLPKRETPPQTVKLSEMGYPAYSAYLYMSESLMWAQGALVTCHPLMEVLVSVALPT